MSLIIFWLGIAINGQFEKVSAGANIYLHLLEHNASDVTAWGRHRDAIEKLYKVVNKGVSF